MNDTILGIKDEKSARAVRNIFNGLGLPVPEEGECRERSNGMGPLILVSRYGFVIRIVPQDKIVDIENPHFIKPLFNRAAGNYRFVVDPGYELRKLSRSVCTEIGHAIRQKYGALCLDMSPANIANVPGYPDHPILIDMDSSRIRVLLDSTILMTQAVRMKDLRIEKGAIPDPQIALYKPLRDILERAWPEDAPAPDPEGIRTFKKLCLNFKAEGKLRADWDDLNRHNELSDIYFASTSYADHLHAYETAHETYPERRCG